MISAQKTRFLVYKEISCVEDEFSFLRNMFNDSGFYLIKIICFCFGGWQDDSFLDFSLIIFLALEGGEMIFFFDLIFR